MLQKYKINCKKEKLNRDWSNVVIADESSFIFIIQELVERFQKKEKALLKKNILKACMGAYWSIGAISLLFFEGIIDNQKNSSIFEDSVSKV